MFQVISKKLVLSLLALLATMACLVVPTMIKAAEDPSLTILTHRSYFENYQPVATAKGINVYSIQTEDGSSLPYLLAQYPRLDYPIMPQTQVNRLSSQPGSATNTSQNDVQPNKAMVLYGRPACGYTNKYMKDLQQAGIPFIFKNIDDPNVYKEFTKVLDKSRISGNINLPVIDDNGKASARPDLRALIKSKQGSTSNTANPEVAAKKFNVQDQKTPITIYSVNKCTYTKEYIEDLKVLGVKYNYKDVDNPASHIEFSKTMIAAGHSGSVNLPAVVINGKVYLKPSVDETLRLIKSP